MAEAPVQKSKPLCIVSDVKSRDTVRLATRLSQDSFLCFVLGHWSSDSMTWSWYRSWGCCIVYTLVLVLQDWVRKLTASATYVVWNYLWSYKLISSVIYLLRVQEFHECKYSYYYAPAPRVWGIKRWCASGVCICLTSDVCLSVAYIGPKSRIERSVTLKLAQR